MEQKTPSLRAWAMYAASALLVLLMLLIGGRCFVQWVLIDALGIDHPLLYRVVGAAESNNATAEESTSGGMFSAYEAKIAAAEQKLTDAVTDYLPLYTQMVEWANAIEKKIGFGLPSAGGDGGYNAVLDAGDGYLIYRSTADDQSDDFDAILQLRALAGDVPMLYLGLPAKVCRLTDTDIDDVMNAENENLDVLLSMLTEAGVPTLDLRAALHEDGIDHHAAFYRADHHWLPETGRWAAGKTAAALNALCGFDIDTALLDPALWSETVYEDFQLGSMGRKLTLSRVQLMDFSTFHPTFPTELRLTIPTAELDQTGDFDILYDTTYLQAVDYYGTPPYAAYLYDNHPYVRVENLLLPDAPRILMVGDSFDNALAIFLTQCVSEIDLVDLRVWEGQASFTTFMAEHGGEYDAVIVSSNKFPLLYRADAPTVDPRF